MDAWRGVPRARRRGAAGLVWMMSVGTLVASPVLGATPGESPPPSLAPAATEPARVTTFPDPYRGLEVPPPVGIPRIPWLAPTTPPTAGPARTFLARPFPLPANVPWKHLFPTDRWTGPAGASGPTDATGLPMRRQAGFGLVYSPTNLGLQALRRLEGYRRTGDPAYLASARRMAEKLRELGAPEGDRIWLPFPYDDRPARMKAPWVNALGQAVALALFSRLHRLEGRPADLEMATGLFNSFTQLRRADGPWVSEIDADGYLWFEHYPAGLRGHVLNAHAYAVLAIRDYWQETGSIDARHWLEGGLTTLRDKGPLFRRPGTWSWYNLRNPAAHANYHLFHVREFRALAAASGDAWFDRFATVLADDFQSSRVGDWMHQPRPRTGRAPGFGPQGAGPAGTGVAGSSDDRGGGPSRAPGSPPA